MCNCYYSKGGFAIQQEKKYYSQNDVANEIQDRIGCSSTDAFRVLNSLGDVVKDKFSDGGCVEVKLFPGLKITSRYIPLEQSRSNLNINTDFVISMDSVFTDNFRKKVRAMYEHRE